jgi:sulfofructose kinase
MVGILGEVKRYDVLGLGCVTVDDLFYVDHYPPPDVKTPVNSRTRNCGGLTCTALVTATRLGAQCGYAGVLGQDELSDYALSQMASEGIDIQHARRDEDVKTLHAVGVIDEASKTRNLFYYREGETGAREDWPAAEVIVAAKVLFLDTYGVAGSIRAAKIAREVGIPIVGDLERSSKPRFLELLELVDHLIVPAECATSVTGATDLATATRGLWCDGRQVVVVTSGDEGCWYLSVENGSPTHVPAFEVDVVDTTGCGDVFHGAYAAALAEAQSLPDRIQLATAAAAIKATQKGGQAGIPSRQVVQSFLGERRP